MWVLVCGVGLVKADRGPTAVEGLDSRARAALRGGMSAGRGSLPDGVG